jgi:hypothetical protein
MYRINLAFAAPFSTTAFILTGLTMKSTVELFAFSSAIFYSQGPMQPKEFFVPGISPVILQAILLPWMPCSQ